MMLSVILPTYNERANVDRLVERIEHALAGVPHELIFVDDSTDGTDLAIEEQARRRPHIALVHRDGCRGLASAAVEGIRRARGGVVCILDADLQHPPEVVPLLVEALEHTGADVAVASRAIPGGGYGAFSWPRRAASRVAALVAQALLSRARLVSDPMSGFFAVRREVVRDATLRPLGYKILLEILVRGRLTQVCEVPYQFRTRGAGESKLSLRQQWEYVLHLLRLITAVPDDLRFVRFCLVGASGALVNMSILWWLRSHGISLLTAGVTATAAATTWNFFLNDAVTWRQHRSRSMGVKAARYLRYCVVTAAASLMQIALLLLLTAAGLPYLIANLCGIGAAAVWNYRTNGRWTWKAAEPPVTRIVYDGRSGAAPAIADPAAASGA